MAAPRMITQDGEPVVHFDLDALENESEAEPFRFTLGGEVFEMRAPEDVDWQIQLDAAEEDPAHIRALFADLLGEDWERFAAHKLPARKFNALMEAWQKHYGVKQGESTASPRSSRPKRKR